MLEKSFGSDTGQEPPNGAENPPNPIWLPLRDTSETILRFSSEKVRRTISRYRAMVRTSTLAVNTKAKKFVRDAPVPERQPTNGIRKRERDTAERIKLAGGARPTIRERAVTLAVSKGEVRTKDLTAIGIPRYYLSLMCDERLLEKVGYGRYRAGPFSKD